MTGERVRTTGAAVRTHGSPRPPGVSPRPPGVSPRPPGASTFAVGKGRNAGVDVGSGRPVNACPQQRRDVQDSMSNRASASQSTPTLSMVGACASTSTSGSPRSVQSPPRRVAFASNASKRTSRPSLHARRSSSRSISSGATRASSPGTRGGGKGAGCRGKFALVGWEKCPHRPSPPARMSRRRLVLRPRSTR